MTKETLMDIGLTEKEAEVYLILFELGPSPVNKIYEKTGTQRRNIYDLLNKLIEKGLVTYIIENKKKYFQPKDPNRLKNYIDEQKEKLEQKKEELSKDIIRLKRKFNNKISYQEAEIYRGSEGIKTILLDCLNSKEVYFIGATGFVGEKMPYFWPHYNKKRIQKKIVWKLLLNVEAKDKPITRSKFYDYKVLPKDLSGPNVIYIYDDKVANVLWSEPPISFVIKDKHIAENYRKYFRYLWKTLP